MGTFEDLSQWRFPEPFRIGPSPLTPELAAALEKLASGGGAEGEGDAVKLLRGLSTELFRLRQKMLKPGTNEPLDEVRRPYRHLEAIWDFLKQADVEIMDHTGNRYEAGLELEAISFETMAGVARETVKETVRPTVYYKGAMIQRGQVVVGKPEGAAPAGDATPDAPESGRPQGR